MGRIIEITFEIDGKQVSREDACAHELERAGVAANRLGIESLSEDVVEMRRVLVDRKLELGHERIRELCAADVRKAERIVGMMRRLSFGRVKPCRMEVFARGISAAEFVGWFEGRNAANDETALIAAHPEHYIIENTPEGRQEIWETNGGSPFTAHFVIDFSDKADAMAQRLEGYTHFIAGKAVDAEGRKVGGSMHQFRDTPDGMQGVLSIDYPMRTPNVIMSGHKMHLAIEFSNWIEAAAAAT